MDQATPRTTSATDALTWDGALDEDDWLFFRVRAVDAVGNESSDSMIVEAKGDGSVLNAISLADDHRSILILPADRLARALLAELNSLTTTSSSKAARCLKTKRAAWSRASNLKPLRPAQAKG